MKKVLIAFLCFTAIIPQLFALTIDEWRELSLPTYEASKLKSVTVAVDLVRIRLGNTIGELQGWFGGFGCPTHRPKA
jgi:hypothetical protein